MINLGLTTWSEHAALLNKEKPSLAEYASKLPVVEIDTPFYGIPKSATVENWVAVTPRAFKFVIKAHQSMTLHTPWQDHYETEKELYQAYFSAIAPLIRSGKLEALLFQFPASFRCEQGSIVYLRRLKTIFKDLPLAIEFRHASWYQPAYLTQTVEFMREMAFILMVIDEPQLMDKSIPFYPIVTHPDKMLYRFHGRNQAGWQASGDDWRKKRTLYRYNHEELNELAETISRLSKEVTTTTVIFNNNSGGDAADNCLTLKELLGISYTGLNPEQIDLF